MVLYIVWSTHTQGSVFTLHATVVIKSLIIAVLLFLVKVPPLLSWLSVRRQEWESRNVVMLMESIWILSLLCLLTPQMLPPVISGSFLDWHNSAITVPPGCSCHTHIYIYINNASHTHTLTCHFLMNRRGCVSLATCLRRADRCPPCSRLRFCPKLSATCSASMACRWLERWILPLLRKTYIILWRRFYCAGRLSQIHTVLPNISLCWP